MHSSFGGLPENLAKIQQLATCGVPQIATAASQAPPGHAQLLSKFKAGDLVWATKGFKTDSEEPAEVLFGQGGTIAMVDEDGDAYIKFDGISKKHWVYNQNCQHLSKTHPGHNAPIGDLGRTAGQKVKPKAPFSVGDGVIVIEDFITDSEEPVEVLEGTTGRVEQIDGEGDAYIEFEGIGSKQWVYSLNYNNLAKAELEADWQEEVECVEAPPPAAEPEVAEREEAPPAAAWWKFEPPEAKVFALRAEPDLNAQRQGGTLQPGEAFRVSEERRGADGLLYLCLADGRGWTFEGRPGVGMLCRRLEDWEEAELLEEGGAEPSPPPRAPQAPFTLERARELLLRLRASISDEGFQRALEGARRQARTRPRGQRRNALRARLGAFFSKACAGSVKEFGFGDSRKGFDSMFYALHRFRDVPEVFELAMDIESRLHVAPGTWFHMDPLRPGAKAYLRGPESAPHLNGAAGILGAFDNERQRWNVHLIEEEEVKLILPANLSVRPPGAGDSEEEEEEDAAGPDETEVPWWVAAGHAAAAKATKRLKDRALSMRAINWTPLPEIEEEPKTEESANAKPPNLFVILEELDRQEEEDETKEAWADLGKSSRADDADSDDEGRSARVSSYESLVPKLGGLDRKKFKEVASWGARKDATLLRTTDNTEAGEESIMTVEERGLMTPEHMTPLKQYQAWKEKLDRAHPKSVGLMPKRTPLGVGADRRQGDMAGMAVGSSESSGGATAASAARSTGALGFAATGSSLQPMVPPMRPPPLQPIRRPDMPKAKAKQPAPGGRRGPLWNDVAG